MDLLTAARDATGVSDELLATGTIRIKSVKVKKRDKRDDPPRTDFLNSFYLHELTEVREAISRGSCGAALMAYLTPSGEVNERDRRDVQHAEWFEEIMFRLGADRIPAGRWPSNPEHPLALSQQFAVNEVIATLASGAGLMGVNGPPGTGKTTMLRDIIAANVVERARRLALLTEPHDAFVDDAQFGSPVRGCVRSSRDLRWLLCHRITMRSKIFRTNCRRQRLWMTGGMAPRSISVRPPPTCCWKLLAGASRCKRGG